MSEFTFTDANFVAETASGVVLVDFWAPWCGPCQMMGPVIEALASEFAGKAKIGKLDVDENSQTAQRFQVMSIPTIKIFKDGKEVASMLGMQSKDKLAAEIQNAL
ncbi:MAG: thioredoxin [Candidatus Gracilibacteria bacterium]|jgi:thioredoxin 1